MKLLLLAVLFFASLAGAPEPAPEADAVWLNGAVYPVDPRFSRVEALAVHGGRILAVGTTAAIRRLAGKRTQVHDLDGRCVTPGLIDAHGHMSSLGGYGSGRLDLHDATSFAEVVRRVKAAAATRKVGEWILGGRWDQSLWGEREFPTHQLLSEAVPDHPVWLDRVDGHASLGNLKAMQLAGITRATPNPSGGEILRDARGDATGLFVDNASALVERHLPGGRTSEEELLLRAQERCLAVGLTGVHDAGIGRGEVEAYRRLAADGRLKLRVYAMIGGGVGPEYFRRNRPVIGERFTLRATKLFADGAMGSRGAWLFEPYADRPTDEQGRPYRGLPVMQPEYLRHVSEAALAGGWQVCTHAIGDRGIRETLDAYEAAFRTGGGVAKKRSGEVPEGPDSATPLPRHSATSPGDHRFRIEHAQNPAPADIPRFARLGVIPSMQQSHAISDMRWAEARVGPERVKTAYAWRRFLDAGCRIAGGSDFPVEDENPLISLYAAVTRQDPQGRPAGGWLPQERMTREEALRSATVDAAFAAFEEQEKGSLEKGKLADFVVWSRDVVACPPRDLLTTRPLQVVIGGELVPQPARR